MLRRNYIALRKLHPWRGAITLKRRNFRRAQKWGHISWNSMGYHRRHCFYWCGLVNNTNSRGCDSTNQFRDVNLTCSKYNINFGKYIGKLGISIRDHRKSLLFWKPILDRNNSAPNSIFYQLFAALDVRVIELRPRYLTRISFIHTKIIWMIKMYFAIFDLQIIRITRIFCWWYLAIAPVMCDVTRVRYRFLYCERDIELQVLWCRGSKPDEKAMQRYLFGCNLSLSV